MTNNTQLRKLAEAVPPSHLLNANNWGRLDDFRHAANPQAIIELLDEIERLKQVFRVNMLRAFPGKSHDEITAEIEKALK